MPSLNIEFYMADNSRKKLEQLQPKNLFSISKKHHASGKFTSFGIQNKNLQD